MDMIIVVDTTMNVLVVTVAMDFHFENIFFLMTYFKILFMQRDLERRLDRAEARAYGYGIERWGRRSYYDGYGYGGINDILIVLRTDTTIMVVIHQGTAITMIHMVMVVTDMVAVTIMAVVTAMAVVMEVIIHQGIMVVDLGWTDILIIVTGMEGIINYACYISYHY